MLPPRIIPALLLLPGLLMPACALALDIAGVSIPEAIRIEPEGTPLTLRGAHVRTYFFRDISLFALYTAEPGSDDRALVSSRNPKRVAVTILRSEFSAESFRAGWREQFSSALTLQEQGQLATPIAEFIDTFETLTRGEQVSFDFIGGAVRISMRGQTRRTIADEAFAAALLGVWLGPKSVDPKLRQALLGGGRNQ